MLEFFKRNIEPKNEELRESLRIKRIPVAQETHPQLVDVWIDVIYPAGTVKRMPLTQYRSLRAIGLNLQTYYGAAL